MLPGMRSLAALLQSELFRGSVLRQTVQRQTKERHSFGCAFLVSERRDGSADFVVQFYQHQQGGGATEFFRRLVEGFDVRMLRQP